MTDYITKSFNQVGVKNNEIIWLPWNLALKNLNQHGSASVSFPWSYTKQRAQRYLYSNPIYTKPMYLWVREKDKNKYLRIISLKNSKICVPYGYGVYGDVGDMINHAMLKRVMPSTMADCFIMLQNKSVNAVYSGDDAIKNFPNSANTGQFIKAFKVGVKTHYLVAGKDSPHSIMHPVI